MWKKTRTKKAVSEVISVVLLLGITISLFAFLNYIVFSFSFGESAPSVSLIGSVDTANNATIIEHYNGDPLRPSTNVIITIGSFTYQMAAGELLQDTNNDNLWNFGEKILFKSMAITPTTYVQVTVVDPETNTIILASVLQPGS
jgi:flagellin-like protein